MEYEIVVRVWEKRVAEMYYDVKRTYDTEKKFPPPVFEDQERIEMHKMDLEDKNTEIAHYRDIVVDPEGKKWIIDWDEDRDLTILLSQEGEIKEFPDEIEFRTYEILGNLYENPQVLT
ncbi:MAG TPA: hypothetical protein EYP58_02370 [bacterium (Candidatus Stahlbacteria)]|nr:hypothetical protein [Candidatus Stahlbacteria bacterium]